MSRKKPAAVSGVLIINKHEGVTSHKIVSILRKLYDMSQIGHTGTLDPMATGVLPILLGRAAKASGYLMAEDKEYEAEMTLGITTDTQDVTGTVLSECSRIPDEKRVAEVCRSFTGEILQIPPMYSAIKIGGKKLYDIARKGEVIEREPRKITVSSLVPEKINDREYRLKIKCSKGTYVRTLCADIGDALGCGAVMSRLCRTRSGPFTLDRSFTVKEIEEMTFEERLSLPMPTERLFDDLPRLEVNDFCAKLVKGGNELYQKKLGTSFPDGALIRICGPEGFIALGMVSEFPSGSAIKAVKLFIL
ncbi:MAG: tRNA pseudouridine(55) synthase TruB [Clostridia bacterium]|nr:tRNA pseudouridine(55) synthase TruB [Clostridia bacterium]